MEKSRKDSWKKKLINIALQIMTNHLVKSWFVVHQPIVHSKGQIDLKKQQKSWYGA